MPVLNLVLMVELTGTSQSESCFLFFNAVEYNFKFVFSTLIIYIEFLRIALLPFEIPWSSIWFRRTSLFLEIAKRKKAQLTIFISGDKSNKTQGIRDDQGISQVSPTQRRSRTKHDCRLQSLKGQDTYITGSKLKRINTRTGSDCLQEIFADITHVFMYFIFATSLAYVIYNTLDMLKILCVHITK